MSRRNSQSPAADGYRQNTGALPQELKEFPLWTPAPIRWSEVVHWLLTIIVAAIATTALVLAIIYLVQTQHIWSNLRVCNCTRPYSS